MTNHILPPFTTSRFQRTLTIREVMEALHKADPAEFSGERLEWLADCLLDATDTKVK